MKKPLGRPAIVQDARTISVEISAADVERLDRIAIAEQVSRGALLRRLVRSYAHLLYSTTPTESQSDPSP